MENIADELHKPAREPKNYRKVEVDSKNDIWSMDLVDMSLFEKQNEGYKYMLTCIDLFSRYAWVIPMKNKTGKETATAIEQIIKKAKTQPNKIWVDEGTEFYNKDVKKTLGRSTSLYSTHGKAKAAIIERFNRTFKSMMYKRFTTNNNRKWLGLIDTLLEKYNNKKHKSLFGKTPYQVYKNQYSKLIEENDEIINKKKPKYKIGDRVRISYKKGVFDKQYLPGWSAEIFTIVKIKETVPYTYKIKDEENEIIKGSFYEEELQKTKQKEDVYLVEEILGKKKIKGKLYYLVKWLGYKKPTYEPAENIPDNGNFDLL
jgi:hypothetical protein